MRIRDIQAVGLAGATPKGGWSEELRPEYTVHTLIVVRTDEGVSGIGSVFTNSGLVRAALGCPRAALPGRAGSGTGAGEREVASAHVLARSRRQSHAHHQRHRHCALGHPGPGNGPACWATPRRSLSGASAAVRVTVDGPTGTDDREYCRRPPGVDSAPSRLAGDRLGESAINSTNRSCAPREMRSVQTRSSWLTREEAMPSGPTGSSGPCARQRCWLSTTWPGSKRR